MKISGFTIVRNAVKFNYPVLASIRSILPICDEFIVNVGDSEDQTLELIQSLQSPKIKIIRNRWDMSMGEEVLAYQTNLALQECRGDWCFYLQADEVIHEADLKPLIKLMKRELNNPGIDTLRLRWLHFYKSYYHYRVDAGWFQKSDRIIRNRGEVESYGDAGSFRRKDRANLKRKNTFFLLYHYGWVQPDDLMSQRRINAMEIGFAGTDTVRPPGQYLFRDLEGLAVYFGSHPAVMSDLVCQHQLSQEDWKNIEARYWYHPLRIFRIRYKTSRRVKEALGR